VKIVLRLEPPLRGAPERHENDDAGLADSNTKCFFCSANVFRADGIHIDTVNLALRMH
jgi:hypothetical protein